MRKETAFTFWNKYLSLVCGGSAALCVDNPVREFVISEKAGEHDWLPDKEYQEMVDDCNAFSAIWQQKAQDTAGEVFLNALRMTDISRSDRENLAELLAECSELTEYKSDLEPEPEPKEYGPTIREANQVRRQARTEMENWTPRAIYDYLCHQIYGQDEAKRAASMLLYNHGQGRRSTAVFCGPSGCGKSEIWRHLAKEFPGLIQIVDASRLSADGWRGSIHVRDIFEDIPAADLLGRGLIVVLDEADKICCEHAIGANGMDYNLLIQNNLLKMLDGETIAFGAEDKKKAFKVDCSRVSVVLLGAFETLLQGKSRDAGCIGFGAAARKTCDYGNTDISYEDLIAAGMRREIAGRLNRIVSLRPLSEDDYRAILLGPVLEDLQAGRPYRIVIDDDMAAFLSRKAPAAGLGVRWMRSQVMNAVDDLMFADPTADVYTVKLSPTMPDSGAAA